MGPADQTTASRRNSQSWWFAAMASLLAVWILACGGGAKPAEVLAPATPGFANQPAAQTVSVGLTATFSVSATGFAPLTYQWLKNGTPIPSATGASYTTAAATKADDGALFTVNVTNRMGTANSSSAPLNVQWLPSLSSQPADQTVPVGQPATFTVVADGNPAPTYQWQRNQVDLPNATGPSYTLNATTLADSGATFRCRLNNAVGTTDSRSATLTVSQVPVITAFSASPTTLTLGQTATLSWTVTGATALSIDQGVGSVTGLTTRSVTPTSVGTITYRLTATNANGPAQASTQITVTPAPTYALTVTLGSGVSGAPAASSIQASGTAVPYSYALLPGYQNLVVTVDGSAAAAVGTVTMNSPHTLAATAQLKTYSILASAGANGTISPAGTTTVNHGSSQIYAITPTAGYQIASLLVDGVSVGALASYTFPNVTANHTLAATFSVLPNSTLTVSLGPGTTGTPAASASHAPGTVVPYSYTAQPGFQNLQVKLDGGLVTPSGSVTMNSAHTLAVTAQPITHTLTASAGPNGSVTPAGVTVLNEGSNQTYTIVPATGYLVADVLVDGVSVGATGTYTFTNVVANHTLSATFQIQTFTITTGAATNGTLTPSGPVTVPYGTSQTFTFTPNAGYQVASVTVDGLAAAVAGTYTFSNVVANHSISVTFSLIPTYQLTVTTTAGFTGAPLVSSTQAPGAVVAYSYTLQLPEYKNLLVTLDTIPVPASGTVTMDKDHTLAVSALIKKFTIAASAGPNGSISPTGSTTLDYGGAQIYTITPNSGFVVADVLVDGFSVGAVTTYPFTNLTANHTISATFATPPDFVLTVNMSAGVLGQPNSTLGYTLGTTVHYGAYSLASGYQNLQVILDGLAAPTFGDILMNAPHTLTVTAQIITYTITASAGPNGSISPPGISTVNWGTSPVYTMTPDAGYQVATLTVDGALVGAATTYPFAAVAENHTISATFSLLPPGPVAPARSSHTATLLLDGKTLVTGGASTANALTKALTPALTKSLTAAPATTPTEALATTLLYDAATQSWLKTGNLTLARTHHTATRLQDGTVLVVGGRAASAFLASAEIYDPATGTWTPTGSLGMARAEHTATLLPNGQVLVAGGRDASGSLLNSERFDRTTGTWTPTAGSLATARSGHSATLLPNGKVLIAGGLGLTGALLSAELFDSSQGGTWTPTLGSLAVARATHSATLLANGLVLVAGGDGDAGALLSAEVFDPNRETWSLTDSLATARSGHRATLLATGQVLVSGGGNDGKAALPTTEVYDPTTGQWTPTGPMASPRAGHTATLLADGSVLLAFGTKADLPPERYLP